MRLFALALLLCCASPALAQDQPGTLDQLIDRITEIRRQKTELDKQEAAAAAELRRQLAELQDKVAKLGLGDPAPPAPLPPTPAPDPKPVEPLKAKLRAAFEAAAGTAAQKSEWAKDLAALYRAAAKLSRDPAITTAAALKQKLTTAAGTLIGPDALREVRQAVAGELAGVLPTTDGELTDDQRSHAEELFKKLAVVLDDLAD